MADLVVAIRQLRYTTFDIAKRALCEMFPQFTEGQLKDEWERENGQPKTPVDDSKPASDTVPATDDSSKPKPKTRIKPPSGPKTLAKKRISKHKNNIDKNEEPEHLKFTQGNMNNIKPPFWFIEGLITPGSNIIYGDTETGKSWLALQASRAITLGEPLLGMVVPKPARVVYIAFEGNKEWFMEHVRIVFGGKYPKNFDPVCPKLDEYETAAMRLLGEMDENMILFIDRLGNIADVATSAYKEMARELSNRAWGCGSALTWLDHTLKNRPRVMKGNVIQLADSRINVIRGKDAKKGSLEIHGRVHAGMHIVPLDFDQTRGEVPWRLPSEKRLTAKPLKGAKLVIRNWILAQGRPVTQAEIVTGTGLDKSLDSCDLE